MQHLTVQIQRVNEGFILINFLEQLQKEIVLSIQVTLEYIFLQDNPDGEVGEAGQSLHEVVGCVEALVLLLENKDRVEVEVPGAREG